MAVLAGLADRAIHVPALFVYELSNALLTAHRRRRIAEDALPEILQNLGNFNFVLDPVSVNGLSGLVQLAARYGLTCYDAAYLELAIRTQLPLATVDRALIAAIQAANLKRVDPSAEQ